jgi:NO-binding membrane sensor protein with MHYT domain
LALPSYTCTYYVGYVVGSAVVAVSFTVAALIVFFKLREKWDDSFWKRAGCALILALAVFGMHTITVSGTLYNIIPSEVDPRVLADSWTIIVSGIMVSHAPIVLIIDILLLLYSPGIDIRSRATCSN